MAEDVKKNEEFRLYKEIKETQWPIVYGPEYNIKFYGMEKLHPFDAGKWGRIYEFLKEAGMIHDETTVRPEEASKEELLLVHTESYINSLKWSAKVAGITEVPPVALLPNFIVQRTVLKPFRFHTGGTILAAWLALQRGWAINIGGGFHHCSSQRGGGFCAYADITLAIKYAMLGHTPWKAETKPTTQSSPKTSPAGKATGEETAEPEPGSSKTDAVIAPSAAASASPPTIRPVRNAMIVDLDAHQGNGHERDFMGAKNVYILDVYNRDIYPHDGFAKRAIKRKVELSSYTEDGEYLWLVKTNLEGALNEFTPDLIVYNAGTDILQNDPLGCLSISPAGIIERDMIVFEKARARNIPIVMVTSGGYDKSTARIIADSILNLRQNGLIPCEAAENYKPPEVPPPSSLPRCRSEGGIWAKFKNCANLSRSSTSEQLSKDLSPAMVRSKTSDSRLNSRVSSQSRSPGAQSHGSSRLQGSGSSIGIARSRTQEDVRRLDESQEDEFLDEELDFQSMLEGGLKKNQPPKSDNVKEEQQAVDDIKIDSDDSSPYDSDESDGIIDPKDTIYSIDCPSYEDFIKSKESLTTEVKVSNVGEEVPEEFKDISA